MTGKISTFGGATDAGMMPRDGMPSGDSGLALYEAKEADLRPDIFLPAPADNPKLETWKRLRSDFPYMALRFDHFMGRRYNQETAYRITNPKTGQFVVGFLVDFGPNEDTGRLVDVSPCVARALRVETDDVVEVEEL